MEERGAEDHGLHLADVGQGFEQGTEVHAPDRAIPKGGAVLRGLADKIM